MSADNSEIKPEQKLKGIDNKELELQLTKTS